MKIISGMQELIHGRIPTRSKSPEKPKQSDTSLNKASPNPENISFQKERDLYEALSIALIARSLIQKAIEISSRLRNLSQQVIITSSRHPQEYHLALAEMNNSLKRINNYYTPPIVRTNTVRQQQSSNEEYHITLPDIRIELETITGIASRDHVTHDDIEELDRQIQSMNAKVAKTDILQTEKLLPSHSARLFNLHDENISALVKKTASEIITHPENASLIQGSFHPQRIMTLFQ